jgi:hypothetical protein
MPISSGFYIFRTELGVNFLLAVTPKKKAENYSETAIITY